MAGDVLWQLLQDVLMWRDDQGESEP